MNSQPQIEASETPTIEQMVEHWLVNSPLKLHAHVDAVVSDLQDHVEDAGECEEAAELLQVLEWEINRLRGVLAFYAEPDNYKMYISDWFGQATTAVKSDGGCRAREALETYTKK